MSGPLGLDMRSRPAARDAEVLKRLLAGLGAARKGQRIGMARSQESGLLGARRQRGKGFEYLGADGNRITEPSVLERIRELAIPPAWEDVWICPWPFGHIQATGVDAAGRKQYRYHDLWRERRDRSPADGGLRRCRATRLRRQGPQAT